MLKTFTMHRFNGMVKAHQLQLLSRCYKTGNIATTSRIIPEGWKPKMVIFDKNGTLVDFHAMWTPWTKTLITKLETRTKHSLSAQIYKQLAVCQYTNKTRTGVLSQGTTEELQTHLCEVVIKATGWSLIEAKDVLQSCWPLESSEELSLASNKIKPVDEKLSALFQTLHNEGIKIGVCTADDRCISEQAMDQLGLSTYIDAMICGNDSVSKAKPRPHNILLLCEEMGLSAVDAIMVGDQPADLLMGRAAGTAYNVGVLSGVGTRLELTPPADFILPSASDLHKLLQNTEDIQSKSSAKSVSMKSPLTKAALVIFDKDGTLINFESMWTPWVVNMIEKLEAATGLDLYSKCLEALGYCHYSNRWKTGVFAEGTVEQTQEVLLRILEEGGICKDDARVVLDSTWEDGDHSNKTTPGEEGSQLEIISDLKRLFDSLHHHGVKIAICTADNRKPTQQFLDALDLSQYVDAMVCGDDHGAVPKPAPDNAHIICEQLGIDPAEALVVGDTIADMGMGRSASLGATVGVLSGVGDVSDLDHTADYMIDNVGQLLPLVLNTEASKQTHKELMAYNAAAAKIRYNSGNTGSQPAI